MKYDEFLENKIVVAEEFGFNPAPANEILKPHQVDITQWCVKGGRRAIFASFGLGKTVMQLELAYQCIKECNKPFLICMPLGVVGEFKRDNENFFKNEIEVEYITDSFLDVVDMEIELLAMQQNGETNSKKYKSLLKKRNDLELKSKSIGTENKIYLTNYERVRSGSIDASKFCGVSFDEASILRNLKTETTNFILKEFSKIPFRFVCTATPTPNDFIEILNYADYLGVIDRGHALTRFFQRDSVHAGHLTLYPNKKEEFWKWVSTWAVFINKPSDLGYSDEGYDLPELNLFEIEVDNTPEGEIRNKKGDIVLFKDTTKSLIDVASEKRTSIEQRVKKAYEIFSERSNENFILWSDLEDERREIEKQFKQHDLKSIFGSQKNEEKEELLIDFSNGKYQILNSKPKIAGSGCNFQHACHNEIFVGIGYKFNDFIQAIHRVHRFAQKEQVNIWLIYTNNEHEVLKALKNKWKNHIELQTEMINLVREYGLNSDKIKSDMKRQIFKNRRENKLKNATLVNNDSVQEWENLPDNSQGMQLTSIPFGDHYEYSDNYNDMGHNHGNDEFFKQMDFLTPNLLRTLMPGRICAVHVKDRIRYSYQNGTSFTTISDFSGQTVAHYQKHGFYLVGKITITTDVVRENNQTYRLTWGECRKDGTKMGVGLPEYVLLFRKRPTESNNAYADDPVLKKIDDYLLSMWQLDAHAFWKSSGNRMLSADEILSMEPSQLFNWWKNYDKENVYDFKGHVQMCQTLAEKDKLSKLFMSLPPHSNTDLVWTDVNRMRTLNANQVNNKKEKHICPLQLDIIERLINRFTNDNDVVADPFGGLFSTPYTALQMNRKAFSCELNPSYYDDGLFYMKSIEYKLSVPTLFDMLT